METKAIRAALKKIDPEITISALDSDNWVIRTNYHLTQARSVVASLGLVETDSDIEGSQWDCRHVLFVEKASPLNAAVETAKCTCGDYQLAQVGCDCGAEDLAREIFSANKEKA